MNSSASSALSRRALIGAAAALFAAPVRAAPTRRVVMLGDSITSGYGLPSNQALPARLQAELARLGAPARVINAGRSGDTTSGGAARLERAVPKDADLVVVALGANDLLLGADPARVQSNLDRIVRRLKARGHKVVLAGVQVPAILGGAYGRAFNGAFAKVARTHQVLFVPDMLAGVALNPNLNQSDGIHPNARGAQVIAQRLAPVVAKGLAAR